MCEREHAGLREKRAGSMGYGKMKRAAVRRQQVDVSSGGKNLGTNDRRRVQRQQGRRVTTATPEQTQGRSDERALAEAKMRDQCAFIERGARAFGRIASKNAKKCGALPVVIAWLGCSGCLQELG